MGYIISGFVWGGGGGHGAKPTQEKNLCSHFPARPGQPGRVLCDCPLLMKESNQRTSIEYGR